MDEQRTVSRRTRRQTVGTIRVLGRRSKPAGGGEDVWAMETGRWRKGTSDGRTPVADRYLGSDKGRKKGGGTGRGTAVIGSLKELPVVVKQGRGSQMSSGGQKMGEQSMWMFTLRPGDLGTRSGCIEIERSGAEG